MRCHHQAGDEISDFIYKNEYFHGGNKVIGTFSELASLRQMSSTLCTLQWSSFSINFNLELLDFHLSVSPVDGIQFSEFNVIEQ